MCNARASLHKKRMRKKRGKKMKQRQKKKKNKQKMVKPLGLAPRVLCGFLREPVGDCAHA